MDTITLDFKGIVQLTDEQFWQLCQHNRDYRFERTVLGEILIMSPTGGETSNRNADLIYQLQAWNRKHNLGVVFDSSGGFKLPNNADRSPDASWITKERWDALTLQQQQKFVPLCPDFVLELRSPTDSLKRLQAKMQEYQENGARLGWLIDRENRRIERYRQGKPVEILDFPTSLSGEEVLPGFVLDLSSIW
ncbi:Uma2 family endonuclease [Moorena sp. SIO4G3]|uniref:Uma2 family endonuclease n=1 Tax=Moorena sp. SIO4G3 TaxID=2607821 RepID=UPI00142A29AC|nr:Uma2 family endonuclease [Moorena sp. SIO4G3]NEO76952.1 Uma2 family endonuclease [Moorena sp. SIO4G3]